MSLCAALASGIEGREPGFAGSRYLIPHLPMPGTPMLSALDLARRIEAGELTPRAVVDMCAEAIAARDKEVGAFVVLDLVAARRAAENPSLPRRRCAVCRSGSRTFSIPPISRPNTVRRFTPASGRAPMPPRWR